MNIAEAFVTDFLEPQGYGSLGTDIFIGGAPLDGPNTLMWVLSGGGSAKSKNTTNEKLKNYTLSVNYRSTDMHDVYEKLQALEELINSDACSQLGGYDVIEMECTSFPADQDLDADDRTIGLLIVTLTIYL